MTSLRPPPRCDGARALFLDVDGTLLDIVESPDAVRVPADLKQTLVSVAAAQDGALALVSGRSLAQLDALFGPFRFAAAGLHGLERRDAQGRVRRTPVPVAALDVARRTLGEFVARHPGLLLEDKEATVALHYRRVPALADEARRVMAGLEAELQPNLHVQEGKCVFELKPRGASKRTAIEAFMAEAPFAGRLPVFAGDDVTDEDGFAAVNALGGLSIRVGEESATRARYGLPSVTELRVWLATTFEEIAPP